MTDASCVRRLLLAAATLLLLALAASCSKAAETTEAVDPEKELAAILTGSSDECARSSECPSRVCKLGFCATATDASEPWMEHIIGKRIAALTKDHPELIDTLLTEFVPVFAREDSYVRGRIAGILAAVGDPRAIAALRPWLSDDTERVRVRTRIALARLGDPESIEPTRALLQHASVGVQLDAADALGEAATRAPKAPLVNLLAELVAHTDYRVRQRAIEALGQIPADALTADARAALETVLDTESDGYLQYDATRALRR